MSGPCCDFCGHHCFVLRRLPADAASWAGRDLHMATCRAGAARDLAATGYDHTTAVNPYAKAAS